MSSLYAMCCADGSRHDDRDERPGVVTLETDRALLEKGIVIYDLDPEQYGDGWCGPHTVQEYRPVFPKCRLCWNELKDGECEFCAKEPECDGSGRIVLKVGEYIHNDTRFGGETLSDTACPGCEHCKGTA